MDQHKKVRWFRTVLTADSSLSISTRAQLQRLQNAGGGRLPPIRQKSIRCLKIIHSFHALNKGDFNGFPSLNIELMDGSFGKLTTVLHLNCQ